MNVMKAIKSISVIPFFFALSSSTLLADTVPASQSEIRNLEIISNWLTFCENHASANDVSVSIGAIGNMLVDHAEAPGAENSGIMEMLMFFALNAEDSEPDLRNVLERLDVSEDIMCSIYLSGIRRGMEAERTLLKLSGASH